MFNGIYSKPVAIYKPSQNKILDPNQIIAFESWYYT